LKRPTHFLFAAALASFSAYAAAQSIATGKINHEAELITETELPPSIVQPLPPKSNVKPQLNKAIDLPGIGKIPGHKDYFKPVVLTVNSSHTFILDISSEFQNRISTPFSDPHVSDQSKADYEFMGQSIYFTPKDNRPITIFVSGAGPNDPVISLTLVPKSIPSQTILLQLDKSEVAAQAAEEDRPSSDVYTDNLRYIFRQMALGKTPVGYAEAPLPNAVASLRGLTVQPLYRYSGPKGDIYAYRIEGATSTHVELKEQQFVQKGVRAIAFFPTATVRRGEPTMAYVFADKVGQ
jgi:conjugal transfer pilus assembly protein TraK